MPKIVKLYGKYLEITEYEKISNGNKKVRISSSSRGVVCKARRIDSLRRTRQICVRKLLTAIEELGSPLLITLTLSGSASDAATASKALARFFVRLRALYPATHALFVPEVSPRGRIHFHGLLFGLPMSFGDIKKGGRTVFYGSERETRSLARAWGYGYVDVKQTDGSPRLGYYLSKYILKHNENSFNVLINPLRMLRTTVGFPSEIVLSKSDFFDKKILQKYSEIEPLDSWSGFTHFTGNISKKKYLRLVEN